MRDFCVGDIVKFSVDGTDFFGTVERVTAKKLTVCDFEEYETYVINKSFAVILEPVELDAKAYQKFARYEISVQDILQDNVIENIVNKDNYKITLEDILCALNKFKLQEITEDIFYEEWLCYFGEVLESVVYDTGDNEFFNDNIILQKTVSAFLNGIYYGFEEDYDQKIADLANYLEDKNKPFSSRRYPEYAKITLLQLLESDSALNNTTDDIAALYKQFAEELCEKGNKFGLLAVGYGCYGGNRVFSCDWKKSEECMLKLLQTVDYMPDQAFYANTLGYIYYYGRINGGVPDYEKAYKYFSFAAFNRIYEAEYKVADMYENGYGVPKSHETAQNIVGRLYEENLKYILDGQFDCKFADIAFRMGNYCKNKSDPYESNFDAMLIYYYQAAFAIRMRMREKNYYGDANVAKAIKEALSETKKMIDFKTAKKVGWYTVSSLFADFLERGNKIDVTVKQLSSGKYKLIFKPHVTPLQTYPKRFFITVPELDMCGMYDKFSVTVIPFEYSEIICSEGMFTVDKIQYGDFLFDGVPVMSFEGCEFEIRKPKENDTVYRFVSVVFNAGGRSYDYLCDNPSIQIGDTATVIVAGEEKSVSVVNVFEKTESETFLPIKSYKRIL